MRGRSVALLLLLSAGGAAAACQVLGGIDDRTLFVEVPDSGSSDALVVVDGSVNDAGADPCRGANVPRAPPLSTSSPSDAVEAVLALSILHLGLDGGVTYGFNLDKACTCPEPDTCQRPASQPPACDDEAGVDNAGRVLFEAFAAANLVTEGTLNGAIQSGSAGLFVRIWSYNGKLDDASVQFAMYASPGYVGYPDAGPKFDGGDKWYVDKASLTGPTTNSPKYVADEAYVVGGILVASLTFPIVIGGKFAIPVLIELQSGKIAAALEVSGGKVNGMRGALAGRWPVSKMLTSLRTVPDPLSPGEHLCGNDATFLAIRTPICAAVDITSDPINDGTGICDSISMGLGFEAKPALFGAAVASGPPPNYCDAGYVAMCP